MYFTALSITSLSTCPKMTANNNSPLTRNTAAIQNITEVLINNNCPPLRLADP